MPLTAQLLQHRLHDAMKFIGTLLPDLTSIEAGFVCLGGAMVIIIFNAYKGLKRRAGESCNVTTNQDAFVIWVKFLRQRKQ